MLRDFEQFARRMRLRLRSFGVGALKEPINPLWSRIHRFLWCTMIQTDLGSLIQITPKEHGLRYIYFTEMTKEPHPSHVRSGWIPPVQPSIARENYLENVKLSISEIEIANVLTIKLTITCDNFVASLTKLVSSWPRDSSETFLLGKIVGHRAQSPVR